MRVLLCTCSYMKQKMFNYFLALALLFALLASPSNGQAATKTVLGLSPVYTQKAGKVQVTVFIDSAEPIASGSFELEYDALLLRLTDKDVEVGDVTKQALVSSNGSEAGKVSFSWAQNTGEALNGTVLTLSPTISKAGQVVDITFNNVKLFDEQGTDIAVDLLNGTIQPFNGNKKVHPTKKGKSDPFKVTLSSAFDPATVNKHTVFVKNSSGVLMNVKIDKLTDTSFTVTPIANYTAGKYSLEISDQVRSKNGKKLTEAIQLEFTVQ